MYISEWRCEDGTDYVYCAASPTEVWYEESVGWWWYTDCAGYGSCNEPLAPSILTAAGRITPEATKVSVDSLMRSRGCAGQLIAQVYAAHEANRIRAETQVITL
jgi:hypothetical protein